MFCVETNVVLERTFRGGYLCFSTASMETTFQHEHIISSLTDCQTPRYLGMFIIMRLLHRNIFVKIGVDYLEISARAFVLHWAGKRVYNLAKK